MGDINSPQRARVSASRVVALMAAGGEWPAGWGGLIPSLFGQLALTSAAVVSAREQAGGVGLGVGTGADTGKGAVNGRREGGAGRAAAARDDAVARAESCVKCLQYLTEEVRCIEVI